MVEDADAADRGVHVVEDADAAAEVHVVEADFGRDRFGAGSLGLECARLMAKIWSLVARPIRKSTSFFKPLHSKESAKAALSA